MLNAEKDILIEMIEVYREHPCLWDQKDKDYHNKVARELALNKLLDKYKIVYEDANVECVKRKLDNLRTAYKRENRKVIASIERGDERIYTPTLWYFNLLSFIDRKEEPVVVIDQSTDGENNEEITSNVLWGTQLTLKTEPSQVTVTERIGENNYETGSDRLRSRLLEPCNQDVEEYNENDEAEQYYDIHSEEEPAAKKPNICNKGKRKPKLEAQINNRSTQKRGQNSSKESEAFGRTMGLQLQKLEPFQRTVAEKLMSEVIFYARLNQLSSNSSISINDDK